MSADFVHLLADAWLLVSDSGGIQEEAASLGKPILVLRENTERPEGVHVGVARLVGQEPRQQTQLLADEGWFEVAKKAKKVYGVGVAADRISQILTDRHQNCAGLATQSPFPYRDAFTRQYLYRPR